MKKSAVYVYTGGCLLGPRFVFTSGLLYDTQTVWQTKNGTSQNLPYTPSIRSLNSVPYKQTPVYLLLRVICRVNQKDLTILMTFWDDDFNCVESPPWSLLLQLDPGRLLVNIVEVAPPPDHPEGCLPAAACNPELHQGSQLKIGKQEGNVLYRPVAICCLDCSNRDAPIPARPFERANVATCFTL